MNHTDVAQVAELTADVSPSDNHDAVCTVLRWAKRTNADMVDVAAVCALVGLDLSDAVERGRKAR